MRPIKFRGKTRFSNEWIYGHYYIDMGDHFIHLDEPKDTVVAWLVRPETVGQFTGMTDMDGKEIYEGDVVRWAVNDISKGEIKFGLYEVCGNYYHGYFVDCVRFSLHLTERFKVISNIHENPELIGGDAIKQKQD